MERPSKLRLWILSALFTALTAVGAQIRIPMVPVPITFQTLFVFLAGGLLGARWGAVSQIFYLILGFAGLPVFAGESGPALLLSPTIGYLLAFPFAAYLAGVLTERLKKRTVFSLAGVYASAAALIFVLGLAGLYVVQSVYLNHPLTLTQIVVSGFVIFVPGEIIKIALAAAVTRKLRVIQLPVG